MWDQISNICFIQIFIKNLQEIVEKYNPDAIVTIGYENTMNLFFSETKRYKKNAWQYSQFVLVQREIDSSSPITIMGCDCSLKGDEVKKILEEIK
ncbi:MAG: hypothetical protein ACI4LX_05735 [Treponema sp.]